MKKMHWIMPAIILLIGVFILVLNNYKDVTAVPSDSWTREVELATTSIQSNIKTTLNSNGSYNIYYFTDNGLVEGKYNESLELIDQSSYDIPYTKWTEVYPGDKNIVYADNEAMYQTESNEKISDIQEFIPLKNGMIYQWNDKIYYLEGNSLDKRLLIESVSKETLIDVYQPTATNTYIMLSDKQRNATEYRLLKWDGKNVTEIDQQTIELEPSLTLEELSFTVDNNQLSLFINAGPLDKHTYLPEDNYYFTQQKIGSPISLNPVPFNDPFSRNDLQNVKDIELDVKDGKSELLFRAKGSTETKYRDAVEYNVYKAVLNGQGKVDVTRLSNTPWLSKNPSWVSDDVVVWLDVTGDTNKLFAAGSTDLENLPESSLSKDTGFRIVGKTMVMLASGLLTLLVTIGWYVVPLGFIGIMTFGSNNALDKGKEWVFYTPALLYVAVALYFNEQLFSEKVISRLPAYLDFPGSPFILICAFGVITYLIMATTDLKERWSIPKRITYFVAVHISFLMIFVGPFIL
ncbi:hypothetical protein SAMN05421758_1213 [Salimicrobium salexigens]|uniref:Uncharacterized protein n=1 Tax=Salimicrobium salexigens TaxID=908941 RepID=A0ABY1L0A7_9BACI|nr:hypothetical protein SAMN05421758_1213 [Salimicrobium salexigens]